MSVQALSWVFDHSEATGSDRLVLLTMANHYSRDGLCCPSFDTIGREARLSRSTVIRAVQSLEQGGHVGVVRDVQRGRSKVNHYRLLGFEEWCQADTIPLPERVSSAPRNGVSSDTRTKGGNQELFPSGSAAESAATAPSAVQLLVAGYVQDVRKVENGHEPARNWKAAAGRAAKKALDDGEPERVVAVCLGLAAREGKNPSTLQNIISDYHAKRPRRKR